jgi:hypothetical protein
LRVNRDSLAECIQTIDIVLRLTVEDPHNLLRDAGERRVIALEWRG